MLVPPPLVHLSYSSDSGTAKICQRGQSDGSEATERGEGVRRGERRGVSPLHGREIFQNLCMKLAFSCTLDTIIRGSLCGNSLLFFFFHSFPNEFVSGKHFPFSLSFSLFFSPSKSWGGGGGATTGQAVPFILFISLHPPGGGGGGTRLSNGRGVPLGG